MNESNQARTEAITNYFETMLRQFGGFYGFPGQARKSAHKHANELIAVDPATSELEALRAENARLKGEISELLPAMDADAAVMRQMSNQIMHLHTILRKAMEHGLNGNASYHAIRASELGDEVKDLLTRISGGDHG